MLHRRGGRAVRHEAGEAIAEAISAAEFRLLEGDDHWFWAGDQHAVFAALADTIGAMDRAAP